MKDSDKILIWDIRMKDRNKIVNYCRYQFERIFTFGQIPCIAFISIFLSANKQLKRVVESFSNQTLNVFQRSIEKDNPYFKEIRLRVKRMIQKKKKN